MKHQLLRLLKRPGASRQGAPSDPEAAPVRVASIVEKLLAGGDENRLLALAQSLDPARIAHVVVVICPIDLNDPQQRVIYDAFIEAGTEMIVLGHETSALRHRGRGGARGSWFRRFRTYFNVVRNLARILREKRIEVVDARLSAATIFAVLASPFAKTRAVVSTAYSPAVWSGRFRNRVGQLCHARVDALVSDSSATIEAYRVWLRNRSTELVVIPNGITPPQARMTPAETYSQLGIDGGTDGPVILQISRFVRFKGHDTLLQAAALVLAETRATFVLCGFSVDPAYVDELREQARAHGIGSSVRMLSWPGSVGDLLGATDIFVHSSRFDSSPLSIHESMAAGLPLVSTNVGGIPELVENEQSGILVPPDDPQALADAILRLIRDPELREKFGKAAHRRFLKHHTPQAMARASEKLFVTLANRGGAPG